MRLIEAPEVFCRANLMSDFELQSPQGVEHDLNGFLIDVVLEKEQQINVGLRVDRPPSVASYSKQGKRFWRLAIAPEAENDLVDFRPDRLFNGFAKNEL